MVIDNVESMEFVPDSEKKFEFPKYAYKKNSQLENKFRSMRNNCESSQMCNIKFEESEHMRENCILHCMNEKCYKLIYAFDPLEEGEIDQRITSFKGCIFAKN